MTNGNLSAWLEVSSNKQKKKTRYCSSINYQTAYLDNLDNERSWIGKYVELDQRKRRLRLYSNEVCQFFSF